MVHSRWDDNQLPCAYGIFGFAADKITASCLYPVKLCAEVIVIEIAAAILCAILCLDTDNPAAEFSYKEIQSAVQMSTPPFFFTLYRLEVLKSNCSLFFRTSSAKNGYFYNRFLLRQQYNEINLVHKVLNQKRG